MLQPTTLPKFKPREQAFIDAYTALGARSYQNLSESGRIAGFSPTSAIHSVKRLLKLPKILNEVSRRFEAQRLDMERASSMTREEMTKLSKEFLRECGSKHSNTPRYMDIICKVNGLYQDFVQNNLMIFNPSDKSQESFHARLGKIWGHVKKNVDNSKNFSAKKITA